MSTEKALTAHGEVEYETVECDYCENAVVADAAVPVVINAQTECYDSSVSGYRQNLCPHCAESVFGWSGVTVGGVPTGKERAYQRLAGADKDELFFVTLLVATFACMLGGVFPLIIYDVLGAIL